MHAFLGLAWVGFCEAWVSLDQVYVCFWSLLLFPSLCLFAQLPSYEIVPVSTLCPWAYALTCLVLCAPIHLTPLFRGSLEDSQRAEVIKHWGCSGGEGGHSAAVEAHVIHASSGMAPANNDS